MLQLDDTQFESFKFISQVLIHKSLWDIQHMYELETKELDLWTYSPKDNSSPQEL